MMFFLNISHLVKLHAKQLPPQVVGASFDLSYIKRTIMLSLLILIGLAGQEVEGQETKLRAIEQKAFRSGEVLEYRVHYGILDAGEARLEIMPNLKTFGPRTAYHVVATGNSKGAFDWFFKVRDRYESYIDTHSIVPWLFVRRVDEGGYKISQDVSFNHAKNTATSNKATIPTPDNVQDLVSSLYYARTIDFANAKEGDLFGFDAYLDDEVFPMKIKFVGRETIKTKHGTVRCIKFHPQLLEGRVFKDKDDMTVWISDDDNKIVIRAQAEILVGSVKMDLKNYSGLANGFTSKIK